MSFPGSTKDFLRWLGQTPSKGGAQDNLQAFVSLAGNLISGNRERRDPGPRGRGLERRVGAQNSQGLKLPKIPKLGCRKHQNSQGRPLLMGTWSREREYLGKFLQWIILFSGMSPRVSEDFIILISEILKIMERRCLLKPIALHSLAGFDLKHSKHIQQPLLPWRQRL